METLSEKEQTNSQLSMVTITFGLKISLGSFLSGYIVWFGYAVPFILGSTFAGIDVLIVTTNK